MYRGVQLNFTKEIEVLCMLFDRALNIFTISLYNYPKTYLILKFPEYNPVGPP